MPPKLGEKSSLCGLNFLIFGKKWMFPGMSGCCPLAAATRAGEDVQWLLPWPKETKTSGILASPEEGSRLAVLYFFITAFAFYSPVLREYEIIYGEDIDFILDIVEFFFPL